jgi:cell wall-associated NlpC family hydrolase
VYRSNGIPLPGDLADAMAYAPQVPLSQLQPGDILFFQNTIWTGLSHTAIYLGGGRFIHAEWYNRGVVVSSFNDDKVDGNYWIGKYLGANRPWGGAAVTPVVTIPPAGSTVGPHPVTSTPSRGIFNGPSAAVTVPLLNVRVAPSKSAGVREVVPQGTNVVILGKSHGWYKVQLPDGSIGWIVKAGVATTAPAVTTQTQVTQPTVGNQTQPKVQGAPTHSVHTATSVVRVSGLNVHSGPAVSDQVITVVGRGEHLQVLARRSGWIQVRTSSGVVGWVKASLTSSGQHTKSASATTAYNSVKPTRVQHATSRALTTGPRLTASVRIHVAPALNARVITTAALGTHVQVLSYRGSWVLVRLPSGAMGYVFGAYVHR